MKICPVCKARCFDDMQVCYGCMHRFDQDAQAKESQSSQDSHISEVAEPPVSSASSKTNYAAPSRPTTMAIPMLAQVPSASVQPSPAEALSAEAANPQISSFRAASLQSLESNIPSVQPPASNTPPVQSPVQPSASSMPPLQVPLVATSAQAASSLQASPQEVETAMPIAPSISPQESLAPATLGVLGAAALAGYRLELTLVPIERQPASRMTASQNILPSLA